MLAESDGTQIALRLTNMLRKSTDEIPLPHELKASQRNTHGTKHTDSKSATRSSKAGRAKQAGARAVSGRASVCSVSGPCTCPARANLLSRALKTSRRLVMQPRDRARTTWNGRLGLSSPGISLSSSISLTLCPSRTSNLKTLQQTAAAEPQLLVHPLGLP